MPRTQPTSRSLDVLTAETHRCLDAIGDNLERLPDLIADMHGECSSAAAWREHAAQFRPGMERISRALRIEVEHALRACGLSYPAIAAVTGVHHSQVVRNAQVDVQPERVVGQDGRERAATRPRRTTVIPAVDVANERVTAWLPTLRTFNEDFAHSYMLTATAVTGETRNELVRSLHALRHNIQQVLNIIQPTSEDT